MGSLGGSFWGFLNVSLRAFGAQLGLQVQFQSWEVQNNYAEEIPPEEVIKESKCLESSFTFKPRPRDDRIESGKHSPYQLQGDPKHQVPTCGRPVFELTAQGGLSFLTR